MINAGLNVISKKLKIDAHSLYKGFFWIGLSTLIIFSLNFTKSVVFANFLRPETFGTYRYILTIIEIASAFSLTGITYVIFRSVAQGYEGTYHQAMVSYLKHAWLALFITTGIGSYYLIQESYVLGWTVIVAGFLAPLFNVFRSYTALLEGKRMIKLSSCMQAVAHAIPAITTIIAAVLFSNSVMILVLTYFFSYVAIQGGFTLFAEYAVRPNSKLDPKAKKFTMHLSFMGTLSVIVDQIDKILLFQIIGPAQLATYTLASSLPDQFNVLGKGLRTIIYPKLSVQTIESIKKHILKRVLYIFLVSLAIFVTYIVAAPFVFELFFPKYTEAIQLSQVYALSIFLLISIPYKYSLFAHSHTRELYVTKVTMIVVRILTLALFLPLFGLWGAVASHLCARFAEMLQLIYSFHFRIK